MRREQADTADLDAWTEAKARRVLAVAFETVPGRPGLAADLIAAGNRPGSPAPADDVIGLVRKRAARAPRRQILLPAGAVALAAALAGGVTAGALNSGGAAPAPGALQVLTAALVKTSAQSFTFRETDPIPFGAQYFSGEWDPATATGEQQLHQGGRVVQQYLMIGRYTYYHDKTLWHGKPWVRWLQTEYSGADAIAEGIAGSGPVTSPADLLPLLKGASSVRAEGPASGPGWTGTRYGFTAHLPKSLYPDETMSGTVSVDSSGRVRELTTIGVLTASFKGKPVKSTLFTRTITYGDFGVAVSVTAPPASQVYIES